MKAKGSVTNLNTLKNMHVAKGLKYTSCKINITWGARVLMKNGGAVSSHTKRAYATYTYQSKSHKDKLLKVRLTQKQGENYC